MSLLLSYPSLLEPLGWTLVHFVWQGACAALALVVARHGLRRSSAQARYLAGCACLVLMAALPALTLRHELREAQPAPAPLPRAQTLPPSGVSAEARQKPSGTDSFVSAAPPRPAAKAEAFSLAPLLPWLVACWAGGVLLLSIRMLLGWSRLQSWKNSRREALDEQWLNRLEQLKARLGIRQKVALLQSALVKGPAVIGWLRPVILVPASSLAGLTPAQFEAILIHELSHIRRHDYLVNLIQSGIETVLFYHPAVWWVSATVREERENCCDDAAVALSGDRFGYARALTSLEDLRGGRPALALGAGGGSLGQRIRRIVGAPAEPRAAAGWVAGVFTLLGLAAFLSVSRTSLATEDKTPLPKAAPAKAIPVAGSAVAEPHSAQAVTGQYPVDWPLLQANLRRFVPSGAANASEHFKKYLALRGIAARPRGEGADPQKPGALVFSINEQAGSIQIEATPEQQARFELALARLAAPFNQVLIEIKWAEITSDHLPSNRLTGLLKPAHPSPPAGNPAADPGFTNDFSGSMKPALGHAITIQTIGNQTNLTNSIATKESLPHSTILSKSQFTNLIKIIESRSGVDLLSAPRVTTLSGRQARISVEDLQTVVTGAKTNSTNGLSPITAQMSFGPSTDVWPTVAEDGSRIDLKVEATINEFLGYYATDANGDMRWVDTAQAHSEVSMPSPRISQKYYKAGESLRPGETLVLGGLTVENKILMKDKVPVLGDIPLLGRLFRSESSRDEWKTLLLLVTPKLVNSYGDPALTE